MEWARSKSGGNTPEFNPSYDTPDFCVRRKTTDLNYNYFRGTPDFNVQRAYGKMRGHHRTGSGEFTAYKMEDRLVAALGYF